MLSRKIIKLNKKKPSSIVKTRPRKQSNNISICKIIYIHPRNLSKAGIEIDIDTDSLNTDLL